MPAALALLAAQHQASFAINAVHPLIVHPLVLMTQHVQAMTAEARLLASQRDQTLM